MQKPWGASALNSLGFVAHQASLGSGTSSFGESPRKKLLRILDTADTSSLEGDDKETLFGIDRERPWLLTSKEEALLKKLQSMMN